MEFMMKILLFFFVMALSSELFSKTMLPEDESRTLDEATKVVEKSKKDRKEFEAEPKREVASEKDAKFQKAFEKLMKDLEEK